MQLTNTLLLCAMVLASGHNLRRPQQPVDAHGWSVDAALAQDQLTSIQAKAAPGKLDLENIKTLTQSTDDRIVAEPITGCFIVNMEERQTVKIASDGSASTEFDTSATDALIAKLKADNDDVGIASASAVISHQYKDSTDGFAACLSPASLETVLADKDVAFVEQDTVMKTSIEQRNPIWGLDRVDQASTSGNRLFSTGNLDGEGIDVYVVDTGVNTNHVEYKNRLKGGKSFVNDGRGYEDCNGHGTHCAGTVLGSTYGIAKKANLYGVRVLGCSGSGSNSGIIAGVDWSMSNAKSTRRPSVLSMSLGGGKSSSSNRAVANAKSAGLVVVVAAGNESTDACSKSPASEQSVITVGSTTQSDSRSGFSNYGTCVDIFAPGSSIKSAWIGGSTRTNTISGTSMATPHVAGAAALELELMRREGVGSNPDDVWRRMQARATKGKVRDTRRSPNLLLRTPKSDSNGTPPTNPVTPSPAPVAPGGCATKSGPKTGAKCVFPFTFRGKTYTSCTGANDPNGELWCSTQTDFRGGHVMGNWGYCNAECNKKPPAACETVDHDAGKACVFPFKFQGRTYDSCTTVSDPAGQAWCSTGVDLNGNHRKGMWGHCNSKCRTPR